MTSLIPTTTAEPAAPHLQLPDLEQALRFVDPSVVLSPNRILRRVIKQHAGIAGIGLRVPHRKSYVVPRDELLAIVDRDELDLAPGYELAESVILLNRPTPEQLATLSSAQLLDKFWRLLFHARVHQTLARCVAAGRLGATVVQQRIDQLGHPEFDEIRAVLRQEDYLLPPYSDLDVYVEFAAVYTELRWFAPDFLRSYFPGLQSIQETDRILQQDFDAEALFHATRLPGATTPAGCDDNAAEFSPPLPDAGHPATSAEPRLSEHARRALIARADRVAALGNEVRAAILRSRVARWAPPEEAYQARIGARANLTKLAQRLQAALQLTPGETEAWVESMVLLLNQAASAIWTPAARLLYDLQKVCVDEERGIFALNLGPWIRSLGHEPIKRPLPGQRVVMISKHLRSAYHRLPAVRMTAGRAQLTALLQLAVHRAEANVRSWFRPSIEQALDDAQLSPANLPEQVARHKLVEELLDRIVEYGFLSMGDLRDAISRNRLKLPDLTSFEQLSSGDQLIHANRRLGVRLDGVYRPGEIYLRWSQGFSSLAFGTPLGRFLTRFVAIPFGGAFLVLEGVQHLVNMVRHATGEPEVYFSTLPTLLALGFFLMGLIHHDQFRRLSLEFVRSVGRGLRLIFVQLPKRVAQLPMVQAVIQSNWFRAVRRYAIRPLIVAAVVAMLMSLVSSYEHSVEGSLITFLLVNVLLNSRVGRNVDEMVTDWAVQTWHRIRIHVIAALVRLIMDVFHRILETIERMLYSVDEWLRFRSGEGPLATVTKVVLGAVWAVAHYVIRIFVNVLVEPQVNPIKHFPIVTVSHKVILPLGPLFIAAIAPRLGKTHAELLVWSTIWLIPGAFGYLVWELKENWRLYAANRPPNLGPNKLGHHGETMTQFLRWGFRSGTLPKRFAKLRKASRKANWSGNWKAVHKHQEEIQDVAKYVRRFSDRELLALVAGSGLWSDRAFATGEIHLSCNRILIELVSADVPHESLWLAFTEQSGWLVASVFHPGWLNSLSPAQSRALTSAIAGFYKMAGVDLVREQVESQVAPGLYDVNERGLEVRMRTDPNVTYVYELGRRTAAEPLPIDRGELIFSSRSISWLRWVAIWHRDVAVRDASELAMPGARLLPAPAQLVRALAN